MGSYIVPAPREATASPSANAVKSVKGIFGKAAFSGLSAISPFLIGAGSGLLLYWLFNITSSPINCAVAVMGAVGAFSARQIYRWS